MQVQGRDRIGRLAAAFAARFSTNEIAASASSCKSDSYEDLILTLQKRDSCNALLAAYTNRLVSFLIIPDKSEHSTEVDTTNPGARSLNSVTILIETASDTDYSENLLRVNHRLLFD